FDFDDVGDVGHRSSDGDGSALIVIVDKSSRQNPNAGPVFSPDPVLILQLGGFALQVSLDGRAEPFQVISVDGPPPVVGSQACGRIRPACHLRPSCGNGDLASVQSPEPQSVVR